VGGNSLITLHIFRSSVQQKNNSNGQRKRLRWRSKNEGRFRLDIREKYFYAEGGETLAWVAQRGGRCPIPGNIPGQTGRGLEQPDPVEDVPARCRGWTGWPLKGLSHPNHAVILLSVLKSKPTGLAGRAVQRAPSQPSAAWGKMKQAAVTPTSAPKSRFPAVH